MNYVGSVTSTGGFPSESSVYCSIDFASESPELTVVTKHSDSSCTISKGEYHHIPATTQIVNPNLNRKQRRLALKHKNRK